MPTSVATTVLKPAAIAIATILGLSGCAAPNPVWPRALTVFKVSEECGAGLVFADDGAAITAAFGSAVAVNRVEVSQPTYQLIRNNPLAAKRLLDGHSRVDDTLAVACQELLNNRGGR